MKLPKHLDLPFELEIFRHRIESSILPSVQIAPHFQKTSILDSKFSGIPYLPKNYSYPKDLDGNNMFLLAQINFSQVQLGYPFPNHGLLQFFISPLICKRNSILEEHIFQHYFKVRYYSDIQIGNHFSEDFALFDKEIWNFPIGNEMKLSFKHQIEPVSALDYRIDHFLQTPLAHYPAYFDNERTLEDVYLEHFLGAEHKIGGYPYFIHNDTRKRSPFFKRFDTLLLQIVSNDAHNIMWGDSGVVKFFINHQKLLNLDFTDVYLIADQYE
nr:YwqG family protein [Lysinibacillus timonensis]